MPQDKPKRWETQETIRVLTYLNENFKFWYRSPYSACIKAIEASQATSVIRDGKQVYNKIHGLVQDMENFLETGKKPKSSAIIWENNNIHRLVRKMCSKSKEKRKIKVKKKTGEIQETASHVKDGDIEMPTKYVF